MASCIVCQPPYIPLTMTLTSPSNEYTIVETTMQFSGTLSGYNVDNVETWFNLEGAGWTLVDTVLTPTQGWFDSVAIAMAAWETTVPNGLSVKLIANRGVETAESNVFTYTVNLPD